MRMFILFPVVTYDTSPTMLFSRGRFLKQTRSQCHPRNTLGMVTSPRGFLDVTLTKNIHEVVGSFPTPVSELMSMAVRLVQPQKVLVPNSSTFGGSFTEVRLVQPFMK